MTIFQTEDDLERQKVAAGRVGRAWGCEMLTLGTLYGIDWFAIRGERPQAAVELKCRTHESTRYPTVYLSAAKWLKLWLAETGMDLPGIFVASFSDGVTLWIPVKQVDARRVSLKGREPRSGSVSDKELIIEVPLIEMWPIVKAPGWMSF